MHAYPRGLKPLAFVALGIGLALSVAQRWLILRALADATPGRRHAALVSWHLGMLRTEYYPATGQRFVPWIRLFSAGGVLLLFVVAAILMRWAQRSEASF